MFCGRCRAPLSGEVFNTRELTHCPRCGVSMRAEVFPAFFRPPPVRSAGQTIVLEDDAGCFYHPHKKAVVPCASCGRFLCSLCDLELDGRHICPVCLETGKRKHEIKNLENRRTLYDSISLSLAILPFLIFWLTIVTAPAVIFLVIKYWRAPTSLVGRTKIRFVLAFLIAGLQIAGWIFFVVAVAT
ncbi:MAG: hypothetical protein V1742_06645 [Pseudomonadota bacterium]